MRLTAGCKATVVRDLGWKARRLARAEYETRDRCLEGRSVLAEKTVVPLHPALSRFQNAEALVLVDRAWHECGLLTDHAFANYLRVDSLADRVVYQPAAREQLCRHRPDVLDSHEISEDVMALRGLRVIAEIDGSHRDADPFRLPVEETPGSHLCKLVVRSDRTPRLEKNYGVPAKQAPR